MAEPSGMYKAGTILLLVGAILHAVGAVFMVGLGILMLAGGAFIGSGNPGTAGMELTVIGVIYLVFGALLAVGTVFGFMAHSKAQRGDAHGAWIQGLIASLLPPLQVITFLGAIFCLVSPEGEAAKRAQHSSMPA